MRPIRPGRPDEKEKSIPITMKKDDLLIIRDQTDYLGVANTQFRDRIVELEKEIDNAIKTKKRFVFIPEDIEILGVIDNS